LFIFLWQILNPNPFPGLMLLPVCGVVPVGGVALISATLTPNAIMKFDSQVNIAVRKGKSVEMRVSGSVEPPLVDIDLVCATAAAVLCCMYVPWLFFTLFSAVVIVVKVMGGLLAEWGYRLAYPTHCVCICNQCIVAKYPNGSSWSLV